jgi:hypothetical protein
MTYVIYDNDHVVHGVRFNETDAEVFRDEIQNKLSFQGSSARVSIKVFETPFNPYQLRFFDFAKLSYCAATLAVKKDKYDDLKTKQEFDNWKNGQEEFLKENLDTDVKGYYYSEKSLDKLLYEAWTSGFYARDPNSGFPLYGDWKKKLLPSLLNSIKNDKTNS